MRLNLGCSDDLHPDFLNVDIWTPPGARLWRALDDDSSSNWEGGFLKADLRKKWPFPDSSVSEIRAHDVFEHMPVKIHSMNEAHRVLAPGGLLDLIVPTTDGRGAFQDPTHVSYWTPNDMFYYIEDFAEWKRFHEAYGITARFAMPGKDSALAALNRMHSQFAHMVWKLGVRLVAVK